MPEKDNGFLHSSSMRITSSPRRLKIAITSAINFNSRLTKEGKWEIPQVQSNFFLGEKE